MLPIIQQIEKQIHRDPAGRGLVASESQFGRLCVGHLGEAARHLASHATTAIIVTGFYVPQADIPAGETDGPLGAALLAAALQAVGIDTWIVTDSHCLPSVAAAAAFLKIKSSRVMAVDDHPDDWLAEFVGSEMGRNLSHLIAVERVGPSHTDASIACQYPEEPKYREAFEAAVSPEHRDQCYNMRGRMINEHTAPLHRLFERFDELCPAGRTIGIGDGGNEIGMGSLRWHNLVHRLAGEHASRVVCRIATNWTILAGVSNWGAQALTAAVMKLRGRMDILKPWTADFQERMLKHIVKHGPAVDGITGRAEPTVDGLPFLTYIQPWEGIRRMLG